MATSLVIGMTTCPRAEGTLQRAAESLRDAGFDEPLHLFAEPGSSDIKDLPGAISHCNPTTLGCTANWKNAVEWLLEHTAADWFLLLQDDVIWQWGAATVLRTAIDSSSPARIGFLSAYTSPAMIPRRPADGWQEALFPNRHYWGIKKFWGALALAIPRDAAADLVRSPRYLAHHHTRKLDELVGDCFHDLGRSCQVYVPSLADHIGEQSTLGRHRLPFLANRWGRHGYRFRRSA